MLEQFFLHALPQSGAPLYGACLIGACVFFYVAASLRGHR